MRFREGLRKNEATGDVESFREPFTVEEETRWDLMAAQDAKESALKRLDEEFQRRFAAPFQTVDKQGVPVGIEMNMAEVNSAADYATRKNRKTPGAVVTYRGTDKQVHDFDAAAFEDMAMQMYEAKQAIERAYWAKREEVEAMAATVENRAWFEAFDVTTGWPE